MHRAQDMQHWYPFMPLEIFYKRVEGRDVFGVLSDTLLVATFNIGPERFSYDDGSVWTDADANALYFSGFGVLPSHWGQGIGRWVMAQVEQLAAERGYDLLRFDGVSSNIKLLAFYDSLGYIRQGLISLGSVSVMCYEKRV